MFCTQIQTLVSSSLFFSVYTTFRESTEQCVGTVGISVNVSMAWGDRNSIDTTCIL